MLGRLRRRSTHLCSLVSLSLAGEAAAVVIASKSQFKINDGKNRFGLFYSKAARRIRVTYVKCKEISVFRVSQKENTSWKRRDPRTSVRTLASSYVWKKEFSQLF